MKKSLHIILTILLLSASSCNLEKDIDLNLPEYESQLVVECYLEPGKPFQLTLVESLSYFKEPTIPLIENANVVISHNGNDYKLENKINFDPIKLKLYYNYFNADLVPKDYDNDFELRVEDDQNRVLYSKTRLLRTVPIDTIRYKFQTDSTAFATMTFNDDPNVYNTYRLTIRDTIEGERLYAKFPFDDAFTTNGNEITIGTAPDFKINDTIKFKLYHITKEYFYYLESIDDAESTVGNPFTQPGSIISNIDGGLGIFTGLAYSMDSIIITK